ncbi:MAG: PEP-CTERM sorting domain-containing protein [Desulfobacterales bacterium]|nr:PEP-CTERM sorting domain-containing protein [Desulfobacterales bacterium]
MARKGLALIAVLIMLLPLVTAAAEITIYDNQSGLDDDYWRNQDEDQEVEPGALTSPGWDLEGMFYSNGVLSIVGEWDFLGSINGVGSGDIFISTSGNVSYGEGIVNNSTDTIVPNSFGYDYVFDVAWKDYDEINDIGTYTLWQISSTSRVKTATGIGNSNPVAYVDDGTDVKVGTGTFRVTSDPTPESEGFAGDTHYTADGFDLNLILGFDHQFIAHFTQECGNDVIMGQVPEPATMLLLGAGLLGASAVCRKKYPKGNM